jgi:hypothetical protein
MKCLIVHLMRNILKYGFVVWLLFMSVPAWTAEAIPGNPGLYLFPDRSWAISGDTVWFSIIDTSPSGVRGNVVHVQLENLFNQPVNRMMVVTSDGKGEGYVTVPDSLGSGVYWLRAYVNTMRNSPSESVISRILTVYHRFEEQIPSINGPGELKSTELATLGDIELNVSAGKVKPRDQIRVDIRIPEEASLKIKDMIVNASLVEPPGSLRSGFYPAALISTESGQTEDFGAEQDGFFVEGRVIPPPGFPIPARSLVILSISDSIPWFDYYFAKSDGYFRFKLKNAFGTAVIYIRAIAGAGEKLSVELTDSPIKSNHEVKSNPRELSEPQQKFVKEMLEAEGFNRLFTPEKKNKEPIFRMRNRNGIAFYGMPDRRIIPSEFINLPDFSEISRELLPAAKFRRHENQFSFRIFDDLEHDFFEKSPLRLINGVPVFDDNLLYRLKSTDIRTIDLIYQERIFGDISFKGVIAIVLNETAGDWLTEQKNLYRFTIPCLQISKPPAYNLSPDALPGTHIPDFRRVFLFRRAGHAETQSFSFRVSDLKGKVVVKIEGVTTDNQPFALTREILVQ